MGERACHESPRGIDRGCRVCGDTSSGEQGLRRVVVNVSQTDKGRMKGTTA